MISRVRVHYFKRFQDQEFELSDHVVLAGPNNSGKTTLLQAIAVWQMALRKWTAERRAASRARTRTGVPITRKDFTAIPLREMKLLRTNTSVSLTKDEADRGKVGYPRVMHIVLEGKDDGAKWELGFEFRYQSSEQIYVKPLQAHLDTLSRIAQTFTAVHVPPFSGIGSEETRYDRPYQDLLIGQGKAGDILRNLLLELHAGEGQGWSRLCEDVEGIFGCRLLPPAYEGRPFILCEYVPSASEGREKDGAPRLDIASSGSGFHQVLLLLAFFYGRRASVLLLDEPDAHLHVILQKQVYDRLRQIASEYSCQLVIATHSEVLIDGTGPDRVLSFCGDPHRLVTEAEREQVREALRRITALDILSAEISHGVLYVEGETDFTLLRAWARVLDHPLKEWFLAKPFWHSNQGRNPREARGHFFAMRAVKPEIRGYLLLDGDDRELPDHDVTAQGLVVGRWRRYEVESYLIHPEVLIRFISTKTAPLFVDSARRFLQDQLPPTVYRSPHDDHEYLAGTAASKNLLPGFFRAADVRLGKEEYYQIAEQMLPGEIPSEVREKLDAIQSAFAL